MIPIMVMGDPSTGGGGGLLWAILQLYVSTLLCLIPLSICLLYSLLRLIKCQDASEASILCALAGCAFYGIVVSSLWKEDMEQQQQNQRHKSTLTTTPIVLSLYNITKIRFDDNDSDGLLHLERHRFDETLDHSDDKDDVAPAVVGATATVGVPQKRAVVTLSSSSSGASSDSNTTPCFTASSSGGCVICLEPYKVGDTVSIGPLCRHVFHAACLQGWTRQCHASCPCCRQDLQNNAADTAKSVSNGGAAAAATALLEQGVSLHLERPPQLEPAPQQ
jgi:Ring finger domain